MPQATSSGALTLLAEVATAWSSRMMAILFFPVPPIQTSGIPASYLLVKLIGFLDRQDFRLFLLFSRLLFGIIWIKFVFFYNK
jgi:hypothetical protein